MEEIDMANGARVEGPDGITIWSEKTAKPERDPEYMERINLRRAMEYVQEQTGSFLFTVDEDNDNEAVRLALKQRLAEMSNSLGIKVKCTDMVRETKTWEQLYENKWERRVAQWAYKHIAIGRRLGSDIIASHVKGWVWSLKLLGYKEVILDADDYDAPIRCLKLKVPYSVIRADIAIIPSAAVDKIKIDLKVERGVAIAKAEADAD